jgi:hypothetical protein
VVARRVRRCRGRAREGGDLIGGGRSAREGGELDGGGRPALEDGEIIGGGRTVREGAKELRRRAFHAQRLRHLPRSMDSDRDQQQRCLDRKFDEVIPC